MDAPAASAVPGTQGGRPAAARRGRHVGTGSQTPAETAASVLAGSRTTATVDPAASSSSVLEGAAAAVRAGTPSSWEVRVGEVSTPGRRSAQVAVSRLGERDALLRHRVAVADGDRVVVERVEVDRDAERRADLVLAAVAAADRAGVVEVDVPAPAQLGRRGRAPSARGRSLRDSGSTATLTGASRGSSRSTVRLSTPPLAFGASSSA